MTVLTNGNYVIRSLNWDNGAATNAGAATWASGTTGVAGAISVTNSLVGSTAGDLLGSAGITVLTNGNYLVNSPNWDNGIATNVGAATWGSGTTGVAGAVSASNSLVGSLASDQVGSGGVTALSNGNYVVASPNWDNGAATDAGAVTWGLGTTGISGAVSDSNSLVGSTANDQVGSTGVTALSNGNYVVRSPNWDNGAATNAGAATWGSGTTGISGAVSASNSLVGSTANDQVGSTGLTALSNGNYVVASSSWDNGAATDAGAATWGSGTTGISGAVSASNSLVGSRASNQVGIGVTALTNGNYVVRSPNWEDSLIVDLGAVTWGSGATGVRGLISALNSLLGSTANDQVGNGGVTALSNGNFVVISPNWDNLFLAPDAGAVTWGSGTSGVSGSVTTFNSLVGSGSNNNVGSGGVTALSNGNYVVNSPNWDNGAATDAGAVTWGSGTTGVQGGVLAANSFVGSSASDQVGNSGVTALSNGNYVVASSNWDNGAATNAGAVTWGNGTTGITGAVSTSNSLVGSTPGDSVGNLGVTALSNGNYVVNSSNWDNGAILNAGALTWGSGTNGSNLTGQSGGVVSTANSIVSIGSSTPVEDTVNGTYLIRRSSSGGAVYFGLATPLPNGVNFASNMSSTSNMGPAFVATPLSAGTATTLQANNDITLSNALTVNNPSGNGGALTLQAGRSVTFNANLTTDNGNLTVLANADASAGVVNAQRDAGAGGVNVTVGSVIDAGSAAVSLSSGSAAGLTNRTSGGITIGGTVTAGSVSIATADSGSGTPNVSITGTVTATQAGGITVNSAGTLTIGASAALTSSASGAAIAVTGTSISMSIGVSTNNGNATFNGPVTMAGSFSFNTGSGVLAFADDWAIGSGTAFVSSTQAVTVADVLSLNGGILLVTAGLSVGGTGTVRGSGLIASPIALGASVTIAPGAGGLSTGSGTLNFGQALSLPATATVAMNGTSKSAFDKIVANGANLAGATLSLDLSAATLNAGDSITLVDNVSGSATSGTFAGLAQGAFFTADGHTMQISYTGGDGNDVIVTKVADITASFSVNRSGFFYLVPSDSYQQIITLTNVTPSVKKPRTFKFVGLPGEVSVVGGTQSGSDWYLNLGDASVPTAGSLGVPVQFVVPSGNSFAYTLEIIGG